MKMVKIQIPDRSQRAKALVEMGRRTRIVGLQDATFIVPETALNLLKSLGIHYRELSRGPNVDEEARQCG